MLLVHQAGSVRVGEVIRYTLTYTPSADPILPTPAELHVKLKNTSAIPLRAAYLHGPYTLYTACYPSTFDPNRKHESDGVPQFEPNLKAGGSWDAIITIPDRLRQTPQPPLSIDPGVPERLGSVTWIVEITSQVIFSTTAAVHFELLVGRDEKSLNLGFGSGMPANWFPSPAQIRDHWPPGRRNVNSAVITTKGVYSKSITLVVNDTTSLWSTPPFPSWEEKQSLRKDAVQEANNLKPPQKAHDDAAGMSDMLETDNGVKGKKKKRVHFVVLVHGLHSNLGADMLYLKESIDAASKRSRQQAKEDRNSRKAKQNQNGPISADRCESKSHKFSSTPEISSASIYDKTHAAIPSNMADDEDDDEDDDEQVIVRGFPGNAVRTERGIQYLGKRLAKYVLLMTYPDQPYLPVKNSKTKSLSRSFTGLKAAAGPAAEAPLAGTSALPKNKTNHKDYAYQITSISFIGHSLGGLIQTYAIAYIQKHSPEFFERIKPINFIALATPFLGLSNENPMYVRFALDFGLVGRTGQDLGLSWTAPKVRSGWGAMIGGLGNESQNQTQSDPGSKPLLRILPSGPAHQVLLKFRNRTVYSNVVNDGIVPLRTSCLLFLDWRGLDRVEKARRDNGLVGTMAEWGWAELTGANSNSPRISRPLTELPFHHAVDPRSSSPQIELPLEQDKAIDSTTTDEQVLPSSPGQLFKQTVQAETSNTSGDSKSKENASSPVSPSPFSNLLSMFRPKESKNSSINKHAKIYKRSQTVSTSGDSAEESSSDGSRRRRPGLIRGDSLYEDDSVHAPPKTTFFESAGDLLRPPLPSTEFLTDPALRPRTIFHDRVYHPEDIPPPPPVKRRTMIFGSSNNAHFKPGPGSSSGVSQGSDPGSEHAGASRSGMKVEEKIARAYHRDLSWRKVLVRLEPDAHNNIIVRRMFANAYGWPVVKHLVDTHFGYTVAAQTDDILESNVERAKPIDVTASNSGEEVEGQIDAPLQALASPASERSQSATGQAINCVPDVSTHEASERPHQSVSASAYDDFSRHPSIFDEESSTSKIARQDSARWSDREWGSEDGNDDDDPEDDFNSQSDHSLENCLR